MGGRRNMFVQRHRGVMAANQRHLLLNGASIISIQHKPNWWKTGKKNLFFTPSTWSLFPSLYFQTLKKKMFYFRAHIPSAWLQILKQSIKPLAGCYFSPPRWKHMSGYQQLMFCEHRCHCGVCVLATFCERYNPPPQSSPSEEKQCCLWSRWSGGNVGWRERTLEKQEVICLPHRLR